MNGVDANVYGPGDTTPDGRLLTTGEYSCALMVTDAGQYHYEAVGTGAVAATLPGEFYVIPSSVDVPAEAPGPVLGPGQTWINGEDLGTCAGLDLTTQAQLADAVAVEASMLLYELSARQFSGVCGPVTVRPTNPDGCNHWGGDYWGGYTWAWQATLNTWGWWGGNDSGPYGCGFVSRVKLNGYPVREILEVKIDGNVLPTTYTSGAPTYRLDSWRYLTRMSDPDQPQITKAWPSCQNLALEDDQPGTFSITMTTGVNPPPLGIEAAKQLACQFALALSGKPCQLPTGVTKINKQGIQLDRGVLASWGRNKDGGWQTGLVLVDAFLASTNPQGLRRRPAILDPSIRPYAPQLGEQNQ